jgi:electron-transferring-flavoprotein dehydrogenase
VADDRFYWLSAGGALRLPNIMMPPLMNNHGCFIVSLGNVCRWLATKAEALGVEIYPSFAASEVLLDNNGAVVGVATGDMGIGKSGEGKDSFTRGMELRAKYTLFAEGARGNLGKQLIAKFDLARDREPQKFGLGLKELWQVAPDKHRKGLVQHSFGWPLDKSTGGGSFLYHFDDNLVSVGFVVHLNYTNPYLSPFEEFQRFKTHRLVRDTFAGGKRLAYGARALTEGGYQSVPKLAFPGGALIGCDGGFMNVPRIKGSHNAMLSGILAADAAAAALAAGRHNDELADYEAAWRSSAIGKDLWRVRNAKPLWSKLGTFLGISLGGFDMWCNTLGFSLFGTVGHGKPDYASLEPVSKCRPIAYPKPDGTLTFDRLSSVFLSNTNHEEDQPVHLKVADLALQKSSEHDVYGGPSARYCPAGVYEWVEEAGAPKFVINAQNCVHCKTCDIKDPNQNITWVPPEGGGGPNYPNM